jgi:hypothetical protein
MRGIVPASVGQAAGPRQGATSLWALPRPHADKKGALSPGSKDTTLALAPRPCVNFPVPFEDIL